MQIHKKMLLLVLSKSICCDEKQNPCPEESSSFLSRLLFSWFDALAWQGFRKPLETTDLWDMKHEDTAKVVVPLFDKYWQKSLKKAER